MRGAGHGVVPLAPPRASYRAVGCATHRVFHGSVRENGDRRPSYTLPLSERLPLPKKPNERRPPTILYHLAYRYEQYIYVVYVDARVRLREFE